MSSRRVVPGRPATRRSTCWWIGPARIAVGRSRRTCSCVTRSTRRTRSSTRDPWTAAGRPGPRPRSEHRQAYATTTRAASRCCRSWACGCRSSGMELEALFAEHRDVVFRYLARYTGDADLAEDLVQETFL